MSLSTIAALVEKFMELFAGLDRAYGSYDLSQVIIREDGKHEGAALTIRKPITESLWEKHLKGSGIGLGIIPIRSDNTCVFGAIDVDTYPVDLPAIALKLHNNQIPMIVVRSKSGGAHLYCFTQEPVPALMMKNKLKEVASFLGYGTSEIFPKQAKLEKDDDVGQWINVPYFNDTRGMRYAIDVEGNALSAEQFTIVADMMRVNEDWFKTLLVKNEIFLDGPPCLQALAQVGYPKGSRNNGLYNIGVYLKKAKPDTWEDSLSEANHTYMLPPLPVKDLQGVIASLKRKDYMYGCSNQPIVQYCNAPLCRTKKYGVGSSSGSRLPLLGQLSKLDTKPPIWFWIVDGKRLELQSRELQNPKEFQLRCLDTLNTMPQMPSLPVWGVAIEQALHSLTIIEAPKDASSDGQFWEMVEKFCTNRAQALNLSEITLGKPFTESKRTYFRMGDLLDFLARHKFGEFKTTKIASMLKDADAEHHFTKIKGRGINYWSIPAFEKQDEILDLPSELTGSGEPF